MKRLSVLLISLLIITSGTLAQTADIIEKPDLKKDDRWVFNVIDLWKNSELGSYEHQVTAVNGDNVELQRNVIKASEGFNWRSGKRKVDRSTWTFKNNNVKEGKYITFEFPLSIGKTWKYELVWNANGTLIPQQWETKVEGWEEVDTQAGKIKALKVVHSGNYQRQGGVQNWSGTMTDTYWYSPEVKNFVRREYMDKLSNGQTWDHFRHELIEYTMAKN